MFILIEHCTHILFQSWQPMTTQEEDRHHGFFLILFCKIPKILTWGVETVVVAVEIDTKIKTNTNYTNGNQRRQPTTTEQEQGQRQHTDKKRKMNVNFKMDKFESLFWASCCCSFAKKLISGILNPKYKNWNFRKMNDTKHSNLFIFAFIYRLARIVPLPLVPL